MSECSGNPANCSFCGVSLPPLLNPHADVTTEHQGRLRQERSDWMFCQPGPMFRLQGRRMRRRRVHGVSPGPIVPNITGGADTDRDVKTCKACMGNFQTCRKSEVSASEGVEKVRRAPEV